ncbi:MAG: response regulator transcription factor [Candidatus Absconditabacteria bacterium]|nr:response regulator transcription factor [Candidatus Absconditabacteria bacterium]MDD3868727.1 response regulator transcription factor [Candidatus Absconditabacteria bacterium]MDD4714774.1 response regulator transcription factor [Candidatus Absconditabacteria bacterium]
MTKILLIEDNQQIAKNIKTYLELEDGWQVSASYDGEKGLHMATLQDFDIVLLDLMLPGLDGKSFCKKYRSMRNAPIIVISAKSQLEDKLELFDLGADDYLTKPFELEELAARIRALLKRGVIGNIFHYQDISVDLHKKEASKKGKLQHLTLKEFQILELLIKNKGVTISRTDIITELRGDDAIWEADNKLDVYISNLRKKLDKKLITTIKGYGYTIGGD